MSVLQSGLDSGDNGSACLCEPGGLVDGPEWEAALERNELALLQHHILEHLSGPRDMQDSGTGLEGNEAILQHWIRANKQHLRPELLSPCSGASSFLVPCSDLAALPTHGLYTRRVLPDVSSGNAFHAAAAP